jgi:hypothetical protein
MQQTFTEDVRQKKNAQQEPPGGAGSTADEMLAKKNGPLAL